MRDWTQGILNKHSTQQPSYIPSLFCCCLLSCFIVCVAWGSLSLIAQASLELVIIVSQLPADWDYSCKPPHLSPVAQKKQEALTPHLVSQLRDQKGRFTFSLSSSFTPDAVLVSFLNISSCLCSAGPFPVPPPASCQSLRWPSPSICPHACCIFTLKNSALHCLHWQFLQFLLCEVFLLCAEGLV